MSPFSESPVCRQPIASPSVCLSLFHSLSLPLSLPFCVSLALFSILSPPPSAFAFVCLAPLPSQLDNEECGVTLTSIGPATTSDPSR